MHTVQSADEIRLGNALCWRNIADFSKMAFNIVSPADEYVHNWHVDCVSEHLHAVHDGSIKRLIINIPPRSMKSILVSISFPAWLLGRDPRTRIICASFGQSLATKQSLDTRLIMQSEWYHQLFPMTKIAHDQNEKQNFMTTEKGYRKSTSTGGSILGEGADYLIADDLIKADEVTSETVRNSTNEWFDQAFVTRLNQPETSRVIVVMQRLHIDDLTGHLAEKGNYHIVSIPAETKTHHVISLEHINNGPTWEMQPGDIMHPKRMGRAVLDERRNALGDYGYAGQYLQQPAPAGGGEFKVEWYNFYDRLSLFDGNIYIIVDPGGDKKTSNSDYTAIRVWMLYGDNNYYLLDTVRDRLNTTERVNLIFKLHRKYNGLSGKPPQVIYKSRSFITELHNIKERSNTDNYRFIIHESKETGSKIDRIRRMISPVQQGRMWLPRSYVYTDHTGKPKDLTKDFLEKEVELFPLAAHDDMMDADSELFNVKMSNVVVFPRNYDDINHTNGYGQQFNRREEESRNIWDV